MGRRCEEQEDVATIVTTSEARVFAIPIAYCVAEEWEWLRLEGGDSKVVVQDPWDNVERKDDASFIMIESRSSYSPPDHAQLHP